MSDAPTARNTTPSVTSANSTIISAETSTSRKRPYISRNRFTGTSLAKRVRLVDRGLRPRHFLRELVVDGLARGDERVLVDVVHLHAGLLQFAEQVLLVVRGGRVDERLRLLGRVLENLAHVGGQALPVVASHGQIRRRVDVPGQRKVL